MPLTSWISWTVQNFFVPLLGLIAICVLLLVFILPSGQKLDDMKKDILGTKQKIQDSREAMSLLQQKLESLRKSRAVQREKMQSLQDQLTSWQSQMNTLSQFSLPQTVPFPASASKLAGWVKEIAAAKGLQAITVQFENDQTNLSGQTLFLSLTAVGPLSSLRSFLVQLLENQYVASIDQLELSPCKEGICLHLHLSVPMAYE